MERLKNGERIYRDDVGKCCHHCDDIVENGKYTPPDPFIKNDLANTLVVQYINLFATRKLEEERMQLLRDWYMALAQQVPAPQAATAPAQANPMALPQSPMVPNNVNAA